ncbi:thiopeptide-type bacteriocin biosynthesis protein [Nocardiopsis tropica]|uniref:Thiopeptide-type bacteriocin biosynthesis protein n=1 Tax=Nocardiopsis tropica TaxID=109330 RepID=A0ABV2A4L3_9ACTN
MSVLLCVTLMRAARLEWYEQGDVWDLVRCERILPADVPEERIRAMVGDLRTLLLADVDPSGSLFGPGGAAECAASRVEAFRDAGLVLGTAAYEGRLERGLRRVLAYHVIFHWNRTGIPARTQAALAWAARTAVLDAPGGEIMP